MAHLRIRESQELEAALGQPLYLLLKHSPSCPISARAFHEYRRALEDHPDFPTGWLHVVEQRPLSRWVEAHTNLVHQSPQALLFVGGQLAWQASHGEITHGQLVKVLVSARIEIQRPQASPGQ